MKPTPGPWTLKSSSETTCVAETARHTIHGVYEPEKAEKDNETAYALDFANANLIAASPDLFDAVSRVLMEIEKWGGEISIGAVEDMQVAIAKAKGESK